MSAVLDSTPASGRPGILLAFVEGEQARRPPTQESVLAAFARLFGPRASRPSQVLSHDWNADPYSRGGYAAVLGPGAWTQLGDTLRRPCGRIHWAGTETATAWAGYLEGAVRSGEAAATAVASRLEGAECSVDN